MTIHGYHVDYQKNQIQNVLFHLLASTPGGLGVNDKALFWFDTTTGYPMFWNGTAAKSFANGGIVELANLTDGATAGQPLLAGGGGGDPAYGALDLSTATGTTGILKAASFPALTGDL